MRYLPFLIALGIVILFGYWSGSRQRKLPKKQEPKVYPLRKQPGQFKENKIDQRQLACRNVYGRRVVLFDSF